MTGVVAKSFDTPDETTTFVSNGKADVVTIGGMSVVRAIFEPGWRWTEHVKPLADTDLCPAPHAAYIVSGQLSLITAEGTEAVVGPGTVVALSPGHDAWTVGDEPCVFLDFGANLRDDARPL